MTISTLATEKKINAVTLCVKANFKQTTNGLEGDKKIMGQVAWQEQ